MPCTVGCRLFAPHCTVRDNLISGTEKVEITGGKTADGDTT
jgi:hypothetical protein